MGNNPLISGKRMHRYEGISIISLPNTTGKAANKIYGHSNTDGFQKCQKTASKLYAKNVIF